MVTTVKDPCKALSFSNAKFSILQGQCSGHMQVSFGMTKERGKGIADKI